MPRSSPFRPSLGRLCAVVAAPSASEMQRQLRAALPLTRTIELRLDWLANADERRRFLAWFARRSFRAQFIATCRRIPAGGRFSGSIAAQRRILEAAVAAGCCFYDLELESIHPTRASGPSFIAIPAAPASRTPPAPIFSLHRFHRSTPNPEALLRRFPANPPAIWKLALECRTLAQAIRLVRLARRRPMIVVPMGRAAQPVRLLSLREGNFLTYAAPSACTAPGQPTLDEAARLYRATQIDRRTAIYAIIGNKTSKSVSPAMHNAAFAARRINAVFLPFHVIDLADFLAAIAPLGIRGFSVTIPHKQAILPHLDSCDPLARRLGAVNTVIVRRGRLHGANTDYLGFLASLNGRVKLPGCRVLLLGAGGAARAAAFALADSGAGVFILSRRPSRAKTLAREAGAIALTRSQLRRHSFDLIVNTTPLGMEPDQNSPLAPHELLAPVVFDMVYRPLLTPLLRLARSRGLQTISGDEMLLAQGLAQWELWTGRRAPAQAMRSALRAALRAPKEPDASA